MKAQEWTTVDKSDWKSGPWQSEPDKKQWIDAETGLPCLIVRNGSGALCGYVGISASHPLFGKDYSEDLESGLNTYDETGNYDYDRTPGGKLSVHGGITFADFCQPTNAAAFEKFQGHRAKAEREALKFPRGDSAKFLADWAGTFDDYDAWKARMDATAVCHLVAPGEADRVWWFGFDCSHSGDLSPAYAFRLGLSIRGDTYRDLDYVTAEVESLAKQLKALETQTSAAIDSL